MAVSNKPKFAVVLTNEAIRLLKDENISLNLVKGNALFVKKLKQVETIFI